MIDPVGFVLDTAAAAEEQLRRLAERSRLLAERLRRIAETLRP